MCTHHKLRSNNKNKHPVSRDIYGIEEHTKYDGVTPLDTTPRKYDNDGNGKVLYFGLMIRWVTNISGYLHTA